jgi:hypothetical protein
MVAPVTVMRIEYRFNMSNGQQQLFDLQIDEATMLLVTPPGMSEPFWTRLDFHQCPHCPLKADSHPHCPVAVNLIQIVEQFNRLLSFEEIQVEVVTPERHVFTSTSLQQGISSLMGLLIAVSGCPYTDFFKPMARFHLPFATNKETIWRATSTYLLAQYFRRDYANQPIAFEFGGLADIYHSIETLNIAVLKRLRAASHKDSAINALVRLDVFAKYLNPGLQDSIEQVRQIFQLASPQSIQAP